MDRIFQFFTQLHFKILLWFYLIFAVLTFVVLLPGSISGHGDSLDRTFAASLGAFSGPFTGAIARGFQSCCWNFSRSVFPYCAAIFGGGLLFQLLPLPFGKAAQPIRISIWCLGLLGWFLGIPVSLLHALG